MNVHTPVCGEHAVTDPDYFVTEELWTLIRTTADGFGFKPERSSIEIRFNFLTPSSNGGA